MSWRTVVSWQPLVIWCLDIHLSHDIHCMSWYTLVSCHTFGSPFIPPIVRHKPGVYEPFCFWRGVSWQRYSAACFFKSVFFVLLFTNRWRRFVFSMTSAWFCFRLCLHRGVARAIIVGVWKETLIQYTSAAGWFFSPLVDTINIKKN